MWSILRKEDMLVGQQDAAPSNRWLQGTQGRQNLRKEEILTPDTWCVAAGTKVRCSVPWRTLHLMAAFRKLCCERQKRLSTANKYGKLSGIPLLRNKKETDVLHLLYSNIKLSWLLSNCQKRQLLPSITVNHRYSNSIILYMNIGSILSI